MSLLGYSWDEPFHSQVTVKMTSSPALSCTNLSVAEECGSKSGLSIYGHTVCACASEIKVRACALVCVCVCGRTDREA